MVLVGLMLPQLLKVAKLTRKVTANMMMVHARNNQTDRVVPSS